MALVNLRYAVVDIASGETEEQKALAGPSRRPYIYRAREPGSRLRTVIHLNRDVCSPDSKLHADWRIRRRIRQSGVRIRRTPLAPARSTSALDFTRPRRVTAS